MNRIDAFTHENGTLMAHIHNTEGKSRVRIAVGELIRFLESQGFHVVSVADKAVREASVTIGGRILDRREGK